MALVPLIQFPYQNAEELGATQTGVELIDGFVDEFHCLSPRGGLIKWVNFPDTPCLGVYWWREKGIFLAVFGDNLYRVNADLTVTRVNTVTTRLSTGHATFASNEYWVYVANGGQVLCWNGTDDPHYALGAFAPNPCAHVAYIDNYIVGNKVGTRSWYWAAPDPADVANVHIWEGGLAKSGGPDLLEGIYSKWREILLVGDRTTEVWYANGAQTPLPPFARMDGAFIEMGTPCPHAVVNADNTWIWPNQSRQIIRLEGRVPKVISSGIEKQLRSLSSFDDAVATLIDGKYVVSFPSDNVTWVYDLRLQYWCRWGKWEAEQGLWDRWIGETAVEVDAWGVWVVGGRTGHLYLYHPLITTDAGQIIRCLYRGPHLNHGTYRRKTSKMILNLRQGTNREATPSLGMSTLFRASFPISLPDGTRCTAYSFTVPAMEGFTAVSISGFPSGLTFDTETQTISGIPLDSGDYNGTINYQSSSGLLTPVPVTLHLEDASPTILLPGE